MHTVELLEQAIQAAEQLGYQIRQDWLDGRGGGACELKGQRWIFLDLAQGPIDHLDCVLSAIRDQPGLAELELPPALRARLAVRKVA